MAIGCGLKRSKSGKERMTDSHPATIIKTSYDNKPISIYNRHVIN